MGGLGFDSQAIQIGHSVAYGSPPLQRFSYVVRSCVGRALICKDELMSSPVVTFFENLSALPNDAKT